MPDPHEIYMHRCIELALLGAEHVAPNPAVGAALVYNGRIIGEGWHHAFGQAHAEVNCISSVAEADRQYIPAATLYVSLEPCAHFGKTPPCSDLVIKNGIRNVVIGCRDPFTEVNGKGIEKLEKAGITVLAGVLEKECIQLNKRFFTFHTKHRPYIILKWAQTADGKIAGGEDARLFISNNYTNRLVHQWRSQEASILVGTETALQDDPSLDNRLWVGNAPVRMVPDLSLRLPQNLQIFNRQQQTVIFNFLKEETDGNLFYCRLIKEENILEQVMNACYRLNLLSILVEGGVRLIQSFIDQNLWDETRIITNEELITGKGLDAPVMTGHQLFKIEKISSDTIRYYKHKQINQQ